MNYWRITQDQLADFVYFLVAIPTSGGFVWDMRLAEEGKKDTYYLSSTEQKLWYQG